MYQRVRIVIFIVFVFAVAGWAQQDANIGTWKLNIAKSIVDPGPLPKSLTLKIEPSGSNGVKVTTDGVDAQGNPTHTEYTANYDGKDYPIKGSVVSDTVVRKRIDAYTTIRIDKKDDNVVQMFRSVVSKDGKAFTVVSIGIDAQGQAFHNIQVFDRWSAPLVLAQQGDAAAGKATFAKSCSACHGADGNSPKDAIAKMLKAEIPLLGSSDIQAKSDQEIKKAIAEGYAKMKPIKGLSDKDVSNVIAFVRTIKKP